MNADTQRYSGNGEVKRAAVALWLIRWIAVRATKTRSCLRFPTGEAFKKVKLNRPSLTSRNTIMESEGGRRNVGHITNRVSIGQYKYGC